MTPRSFTSEYSPERVLITVKTYPTAHASHGEIVCTAGINDRGEWRRLWPIPYRQLEQGQRFPRYEWIEARVKKSQTDPRKESYNVDQDSLRRTGHRLDTKNQWQSRRALLVPRANRSIEELLELHDKDRTSMGFLRPRSFDALAVEMLPSTEWSPERRAAIDRLNLLSAAGRPLEMLPFRLRLAYTCDDPTCPGHDQMITDWEVGAFYFNRVRGSTNPDAAAAEVRKHFSRFFTAKHDTWLFVGTNSPVWPTFIVTGIFYPQPQAQRSLFDLP